MATVFASPLLTPTARKARQNFGGKSFGGKRLKSSPASLCRPSLAQRRSSTPILRSAPEAVDTELDNGVSSALELLLNASENASAKPIEVYKAMRTIEKNTSANEDWPEVIGGTETPGRFWRLVFTADKKVNQAVLKNQSEGGGSYFPLTAVQNFDFASKKICNGIYLGYIAALRFKGNFDMKGKKLQFAFEQVEIKIGPWSFSFDLSGPEEKRTAFFIFLYASDDLVIAKGESGGTAYWTRASPSWLLERGVNLS